MLWSIADAGWESDQDGQQNNRESLTRRLRQKQLSERILGNGWRLQKDNDRSEDQTAQMMKREDPSAICWVTN